MDSFVRFCNQATDKQLANIIEREHKAKRYGDRDKAEGVGYCRGWSEWGMKKMREAGELGLV